MKTSTSPLPPLRAVKILDQLRERIRYLHYSIRTEDAYVYWVKAFIRFNHVRHPAEMGAAEVEAFLSWLANERGVAASTHKQALSALLFLYHKVLGIDIPWLTEIGRPRTYKRLPVVLSHDEIARILALLRGRASIVCATFIRRLTKGLQLCAHAAVRSYARAAQMPCRAAANRVDIS